MKMIYEVVADLLTVLPGVPDPHHPRLQRDLAASRTAGSRCASLLAAPLLACQCAERATSDMARSLGITGLRRLGKGLV